MAFSVQYSFNNGAVTGTVTSITALRQAIYNYAHSGSVSSSTGSNYSHLTQCTLSGTAEGVLTIGNERGTSTGPQFGMFYNCSSLVSVDLSNLDTSNVTNMRQMFYGCSSLTSINLSDLDTSNVTDISSMFYGCSGLTNIDISNFNMSNVTIMGGMFQNCSSLIILDLSNLNTSNVTSMNSIFYNCTSLTSLNLSNFSTRKVANMSGMFYGCTNLTSLDLSSFDTSNVTNMSGMFRECTSLTSLDLSNFNTTRVTNIVSMFYGCSGLTNLDLSRFNTSGVTDMTGLFYGCSALIILDLSNFNTNNVTNMTSMFEGCINLKHIYVSSLFIIMRVSSSGNMFYNCTKLPNFNSNIIDKTRAFVGDIGYLENLIDALNTAGIYYKHGSNVFMLKFSNEYVAPERIEPEPEPEPPEPPSEWNLTFDGGSNTYTADVSASSDRDFGPTLTWVEGKVYRIVFDCKVTAKSSTGVSISIRNQAQSYTFFTTTTLQVGDTKHIDDSYTETRSRSRSTFVARRAGTGNSYSVEISNVKVYEHI